MRPYSESLFYLAEDWYANDYPDEEDERSEEGSGTSCNFIEFGSVINMELIFPDIFHEDSDYDDMIHDPSGSEHDWR